MQPRIIAILILVPFSILTIAAVAADGADGFAAAITLNLTALQIWLDLVIAMVFWCFWVMRDAREAGRNGIPWVISGLIVGAFAPLLYMLVYQRWPASSPAQPVGESSASTRRTLGVVVLALFGALTAAALISDGTDVPAVITATLSNLQIWVDLVIMIVLWLVWMVKDARANARNPWGWVVFALVLGSFAPLFYLVVYGRWPASHNTA